MGKDTICFTETVLEEKRAKKPREKSVPAAQQTSHFINFSEKATTRVAEIYIPALHLIQAQWKVSRKTAIREFLTNP